MPRTHANATTTPEMREFIRNSDMSVAALARLLNISEATVRKWKKRDSVEDASHAPRQLNTTLSPVQEYVVIELRVTLLLSLDELLQVTQAFINPDASRAGLARCLKRHGVSRLSGIHDNYDFDAEETEPARLVIERLPTHEAIAPEINSETLQQMLCEGNPDKELDVVNVSSKKLPRFSDEQTEVGLFIAHDPETRWVYVDIYTDDATQASSRYMSHALREAPFHIRRVLAGNYHEFLQRYRLVDAELTIDLTAESLNHSPE